MKILISSCTQHNEDGFKDTKLYKSVLKTLCAEHINNDIMFIRGM